MMISKAQIQMVMKLYGGNTKVAKHEKSGAVSAARQADEVTLSREALNAQQVQKNLSEIPDIRQAKILDLQDKIQSGTYNVSGEDIAEQIIGRSVVDYIL